MKKLLLAGGFLIFTADAGNYGDGFSKCQYTYKNFRGMDYVIIVTAGYHSNSTAIINLTKDELEVQKLRNNSK